MGTISHHLTKTDEFIRRADLAAAGPVHAAAAVALGLAPADSTAAPGHGPAHPVAGPGPADSTSSGPNLAVANAAASAKHAAAAAAPAADLDPIQVAAVALRRAASHAATALAVHYGCKHSSRRRLEFAIHLAVCSGRLSRSHLKTFRQVHNNPHSFPRPLSSSRSKTPSPRPETRASHPKATLPRPESLAPHSKPRSSRPESPSSRSKPPSQNHAVHPVNGCKSAIRRLRRRVAAMLAAVAALVAGNPKPVRYHKLWLRKANLPTLPELSHIRDVLDLPNYQEIIDRFNLIGAPMAAEPDPHGWYNRGQAPIPCPCHQALWDKHEAAVEHRIVLSPLWRRALEKTFRVKLPDPLTLSC